MKKMMTMVAFFAAATMLFAGCGDDDDNVPSGAAPKIVLEGGDIDAVQEIVKGMKVKVSVEAVCGIASFVLEINSPVLTAEELKGFGLAQKMNLVKPETPEIAGALAKLGFPVGDKLYGKTNVAFDISQFIPLIAKLAPITASHNFKLTVTDAAGQTTIKTLKFHFTAPAPAK